MDGRLRNMTSLYIMGKDKMLLLLRQGGRVADNVWTGSAGGHFEENELNDARACVLRETKEELGLDETDLRDLSLRYVTLRRIRGEIRQNYYFFAKLKEGTDENLTSDEGICRWFPYSELPISDMPYSARYVITHFLEIGHETDCIYVGVAGGDGLVFTELPEY